MGRGAREMRWCSTTMREDGILCRHTRALGTVERQRDRAQSEGETHKRTEGSVQALTGQKFVPSGRTDGCGEGRDEGRPHSWR
jgi:hypothetical protein